MYSDTDMEYGFHHITEVPYIFLSYILVPNHFKFTFSLSFNPLALGIVFFDHFMLDWMAPQSLFIKLITRSATVYLMLWFFNENFVMSNTIIIVIHIIITINISIIMI